MQTNTQHAHSALFLILYKSECFTLAIRQIASTEIAILWKTGKRKVQGVPQSQAAALPRHQEEEETDKTKQAQIEQTYEKH